MSEQTARELAEAKRVQDQRREAVDASKRACLAAVASGIPERVDQLAKGMARAQPEVTKGLGPDGIKQLRQDLAAAAETLAAKVAGAADQIVWPEPFNEYSSVHLTEVRSALGKFLSGRRVDDLVAVLKKHGYPVQEDALQRDQGAVSPYSLFHEDDLAEVVPALTALKQAESDVERRKRLMTAILSTPCGGTSKSGTALLPSPIPLLHNYLQ